MDVIWIFLPVLGAALTHAPVLRYDLFPALKRQLDIAPGTQLRSALGILLTLLDQGDFVFGIWLTLLPVWVMSPAQALLAFAVVVVVHLGVNLLGYAIGARTTRL